MMGLIEMYYEGCDTCRHRFIFDVPIQQKRTHGEYDETDIYEIDKSAKAVILDFFDNWPPKAKADIFVDDSQPIFTLYFNGMGSYIVFSPEYIKAHDGPYYLEDLR